MEERRVGDVEGLMVWLSSDVEEDPMLLGNLPHLVPARVCHFESSFVGVDDCGGRVD